MYHISFGTPTIFHITNIVYLFKFKFLKKRTTWFFYLSPDSPSFTFEWSASFLPSKQLPSPFLSLSTLISQSIHIGFSSIFLGLKCRPCPALSLNLIKTNPSNSYQSESARFKFKNAKPTTQFIWTSVGPDQVLQYSVFYIPTPNRTPNLLSFLILHEVPFCIQFFIIIFYIGICIQFFIVLFDYNLDVMGSDLICVDKIFGGLITVWYVWCSILL